MKWKNEYVVIGAIIIGVSLGFTYSIYGVLTDQCSNLILLLWGCN